MMSIPVLANMSWRMLAVSLCVLGFLRDMDFRSIQLGSFLPGDVHCALGASRSHNLFLAAEDLDLDLVGGSEVVAGRQLTLHLVHHRLGF